VETGKHYNYFRDYDPSIGRYVQSDPIGLRGGPNTFGYVAGRPLQFSDPFGLILCDDWGDMAMDWALGRGSRNRFYGSGSSQSSEVRGLPSSRDAVEFYKKKNAAELAKGDCCDPTKLQPVTNYAVKFGPVQLAQALIMKSCAWNYIGSYRMDIIPIDCKTARVFATNNSSFTSFSYGMGPSWQSGPMSNFYQTYSWDEHF
jgi:uncharacterized protein RhaS with RHS repeats